MAAQQFGSIYYRTWFGAGWVTLNMMETLDFLWQKRMEIEKPVCKTRSKAIF